MSRVSLFSAPFLLGFDAYEERIDRLSRAALISMPWSSIWVPEVRRSVNITAPPSAAPPSNSGAQADKVVRAVVAISKLATVERRIEVMESLRSGAQAVSASPIN